MVDVTFKVTKLLLMMVLMANSIKLTATALLLITMLALTNWLLHHHLPLAQLVRHSELRYFASTLQVKLTLMLLQSSLLMFLMHQLLKCVKFSNFQHHQACKLNLMHLFNQALMDYLSYHTHLRLITI